MASKHKKISSHFLFPFQEERGVGRKMHGRGKQLLTWIKLSAHKLQHDTPLCRRIESIQPMERHLLHALHMFLPHSHQSYNLECHTLLLCTTFNQRLLSQSHYRRSHPLPQMHHSSSLLPERKPYGWQRKLAPLVSEMALKKRLWTRV